MRITWSSPNLLPKKLLFIDGITRSGKSLVGPIMSSFKKSYPFQHQALLDNLMPLIKKKSINLLAAKSLLINYYNQNIYCLNISRQMNFRPDDNSSLTKNKDYKFYKKNLNKKEGDYVIDEINKKNYLPVYVSHDLLSMINVFEKMKFPYQVIYTYRHPVDNIFSLFKRYKKLELNKKYNLNNPRIYQIMIKKNNSLLPYYTFGEEKYFKKLNFAEKIAFYYLYSLKTSIKEYKKFNKKKKILFIKYDDITTKTNEELKKILKFTSLKASSFTNKTLRSNKVPRKIDLKRRNEKKSILKKFLRKKIYDEVLKIEKKYEEKSLFKLT